MYSSYIVTILYNAGTQHNNSPVGAGGRVVGRVVGLGRRVVGIGPEKDKGINGPYGGG